MHGTWSEGSPKVNASTLICFPRALVRPQPADLTDGTQFRLGEGTWRGHPQTASLQTFSQTVHILQDPLLATPGSPFPYPAGLFPGIAP